MCRSPVASPTVGAMEKKELRFSDAQAPSLLVFEVPALIAAGGEPLFTLALPLLKRQGGFLVAFPCGVIDPEAFPSTPADEDQMLGLARTFEGLALYEEEETEAGGLQLIPTGTSCSVVVCDVLDSILVYLREFDPVTDSQVELVPFDEARPAAVPMHAEITPLALEWARSEVEGRVLFYSAREEQEPPVAPAPRTAKKATAKRVTTASLAEQVSALSAQMSLLLKQQAVTANGPAAINPGQQSPIASPAAGRGGIGGGYRVPPVSQMLSPPPKTANGAPLAILGPPPKVRQVPPQVPLPAEEPYDILDEGALPDTTAAVLSQQSAALTALVTHLVGQDNPLDLSGTIGTASSSTKGTMRREKMQQELAGRKSNFFLQIQQQIHKKMYPSRMLPKTEEEPISGPGVTHGILGAIWWIQGTERSRALYVDFCTCNGSASAGDFVATKEFLALGGHGVGAECLRCGRLVTCLRFDDGRGSPSYHVQREDELANSGRPSFLAAGPANFGLDQFGLHQRARGALHQTCRDAHKERRSWKPFASWQEQGRGGGKSQPKAPASVSQETEGHCRRLDMPSGSMMLPQANHNIKRQEVARNSEFNRYSEEEFFAPPRQQQAGSVATPPGNVQEVREPPPASAGCSLSSYQSWCARLTTLVLRTRSAFSAFLHLSIQVSKFVGPRGKLAPAFFPIPVPTPGIFDRMPARPSRKKRQSIFLSRAVHVISMAMNFWHFAGSFRSQVDLWRSPNQLHRRFFSFVRALIRSDGLTAEFDMLRSGRKNPDLHARLFDLIDAFQKQGCSANPYDRSFQGFQVPRDEEKFPELQPYRDLDPSRLKLSGTGHWDASSFLSENLLMAYKEPLVLWLDRTPEIWEYPRLRDSQATILELAHIWDSKGLLLLHKEGVQDRRDFEKVRIFNAYKNATTDRQIGDRRGRNAVEAVVKGPSHNLPSGADLCDLVVDVSSQTLAISISDRKDYYHQIKVTQKRAVCNTLGPGLPEEAVSGLQAYGNFLLKASSKRRYDRLRDGDRLGHQRRPLGSPDDGLIWAAFNSILQRRPLWRGHSYRGTHSIAARLWPSVTRYPVGGQQALQTPFDSAGPCHR